MVIQFTTCTHSSLKPCNSSSHTSMMGVFNILKDTLNQGHHPHPSTLSVIKYLWSAGSGHFICYADHSYQFLLLAFQSWVIGHPFVSIKLFNETHYQNRNSALEIKLCCCLCIHIRRKSKHGRLCMCFKWRKKHGILSKENSTNIKVGIYLKYFRIGP